MARRSSPRRRKPAPVGGFTRTLLYAGLGLVCLVLAAAVFGAALVVRPSTTSDSVSQVVMTLDSNNLTTSRAELELRVDPRARYDLYLTVASKDVDDGDYCSLDVEARRPGSSRYVSYTSAYFGDQVVRKRRLGRDSTETYELDRSLTISSSAEVVTLSFTATGAWFASMKPVPVTIDVVEVTLGDRALLVSTSVLQVCAFPIAFLGVLLVWIALMRQLRLVGVVVAPPGRFRPGRTHMRRAQTEGGEP